MSITWPSTSYVGITEREQGVIDLVPASIAVLDTATDLHAALVSAGTGELWLRRIVVTP